MRNGRTTRRDALARPALVGRALVRDLDDPPVRPGPGQLADVVDERRGRAARPGGRRGSGRRARAAPPAGSRRASRTRRRGRGRTCRRSGPSAAPRGRPPSPPTAFSLSGGRNADSRMPQRPSSAQVGSPTSPSSALEVAVDVAHGHARAARRCPSGACPSGCALSRLATRIRRAVRSRFAGSRSSSSRSSTAGRIRRDGACRGTSTGSHRYRRVIATALLRTDDALTEPTGLAGRHIGRTA